MNTGTFSLNGALRFVSPELVVVQNSATFTVPHGLGKLPVAVRWVLVCKKAELGYSVNDELDVLSARDSSNSGPHFTIGASGALAWLAISTVNNIQVVHFTTQTFTTITAANWKFKCYANA